MHKPFEISTIELMTAQKLRWKGFFTVAFGTFMATIDFSALSVALPPMARDLGATLPQAEWVVVAYILTIGALLLPLGRSGDYWGKNKIFKIGFAFFVVSSALCGFSTSVVQLIGFRILQGLGGAIYMSVGQAIMVESFPPQERGKAIGFMGTVVSLGLMLGAPLGGLLTHYFSWRAIFFINIPIGLLGILSSAIILKDDIIEKNGRGFDIGGAFLSVVASLSFLILLSRLSAWGIISWKSFGLFILCGVSGFLFFYVEKDNPHGILDLDLFKNRFFLLSNLSLLLKFISTNIVYFLVPFYLSDMLHYSQSHVGLMMMAIPATFAILNPVAGSLSDRIGTHILPPLGLFFGVFAYGFIAMFTLETSWQVIFWGLMGIGLSSGFFQAPNASGIFGSVNQNRLGTASAIISTMRNYGSVMGVVLATLIFTARLKSYDGVGAQFSMHELPPHLFILSFRDTLFVAAAIVLLAALLSLCRGKPPQIRDHMVG